MFAPRSSLLPVSVGVLTFFCSFEILAATISITTPAHNQEYTTGSGFGAITGMCSEKNVTIKVRISNTVGAITTAREWSVQTDPWTGSWNTSDPGTPTITLQEGTWEVRAWIIGADPEVIDINDGPVNDP
jgi:hypothetical protein